MPDFCIGLIANNSNKFTPIVDVTLNGALLSVDPSDVLVLSTDPSITQKTAAVWITNANGTSGLALYVPLKIKLLAGQTLYSSGGGVAVVYYS